MSQETWIAFVRALAFQAALYKGRQDLFEAAIAPAEVKRWRFRHEYEHPSFTRVEGEGFHELHINGTQNPVQGVAHLWGYLGRTYGGGAANRKWWETSERMYDKIKESLPDKSDDTVTLRFIGHSYGAAMAQIIAELAVNDGYDPARVEVIALASPKPFTSLVPTLQHKVEILRSTNDIVPTYPPSFAPVWAVDPITGVLPYPNKLAGWEHRGELWSLKADGSHLEDQSGGEVDPVEDQGLSFAEHEHQNYWYRLEAAGREQGWTAGAGYKFWEKLYYDSVFGVTDTETVENLSGFPGYPFDPRSFLFVSGANHSKGVFTMNDGIWCKLHFRMGASGWTESYLYRPVSGPTPTLTSANSIAEALITERIKVGAPKLRHGTHYYIDGVSYRRDGGRREGWMDWAPDVVDKDKDQAGTQRGDSEYPFMGLQVRLWSGDAASRLLLLRPIEDTAYMDKDGRQYAQVGLFDQAKQFVLWMASKGHWHIKARDRVTPPVKDVTQVVTAALAAGLAQLTIPAHGYVQGQKIAITGGDKVHGPLRGVHRVLTVTSPDVVTIDFGKDVVQGYGGPKVQAVEYAYYPITTYQAIRVSKRDTGRPIKQGHGGR
jgi:hypothetical protein